MNKKSIAAVCGAAVFILLIVLLVKIIRGALAIAGGLLNTVLGIAIVLAMLGIVVWMLSYAKKHKK